MDSLDAFSAGFLRQLMREAQEGLPMPQTRGDFFARHLLYKEAHHHDFRPEVPSSERKKARVLHLLRQAHCLRQVPNSEELVWIGPAAAAAAAAAGASAATSANVHTSDAAAASSSSSSSSSSRTPSSAAWLHSAPPPASTAPSAASSQLPSTATWGKRAAAGSTSATASAPAAAAKTISSQSTSSIPPLREDSVADGSESMDAAPPNPTTSPVPTTTSVHDAPTLALATDLVEQLVARAAAAQTTASPATTPPMVSMLALWTGGRQRLRGLVLALSADHALVFDLPRLGDAAAVARCLQPLCSSPAVIKASDDVAGLSFGLSQLDGLKLVGALDMQLVHELLTPSQAAIGLGAFVASLGGLARPASGPSSISPAAQDQDGVAVFLARQLQGCTTELFTRLQHGRVPGGWEMALRLSQQRHLFGVQSSGWRPVGLQTTAGGGVRLRSLELVHIMPATAAARVRQGEQLGLALPAEGDELRRLLVLLPPGWADAVLRLCGRPGGQYVLASLVADRGQRPVVQLRRRAEWEPSVFMPSDGIGIERGGVAVARCFLFPEEPGLVTRPEDLQFMLARANGRLGPGGRCGVEGTLHHMLPLLGADGQVLGLTICALRVVEGLSSLLGDVLDGAGKSLLVLGSPGSGRSTLLRAAAEHILSKTPTDELGAPRAPAADGGLVLLDTTGDIAGLGSRGESGRRLRGARRVLPCSGDNQAELMQEAVHSHGARAVVVDDLAPRAQGVLASARQRGVRVVAGLAVGLTELLADGELRQLLGRTVLEEDLSGSGCVERRIGPGLFSTVVVCGDDGLSWTLLTDAQQALDDYLAGASVEVQRRRWVPPAAAVEAGMPAGLHVCVGSLVRK